MNIDLKFLHNTMLFISFIIITYFHLLHAPAAASSLILMKSAPTFAVFLPVPITT